MINFIYVTLTVEMIEKQHPLNAIHKKNIYITSKILSLLSISGLFCYLINSSVKNLTNFFLLIFHNINL